jgi:hypothetical protein
MKKPAEHVVDNLIRRMTPDKLAAHSERLVAAIRPILAGQGSVTQGAVLAELVSMWVAGHFVPDSRIETEEMRKQMLELFMETTERLIRVAEEELRKQGHEIPR